MAKILLLALTGFGKTTSLAPIKYKKGNIDIDIKGLPVGETYVISSTSKPLPFRNSEEIYKPTYSYDTMQNGNRLCSDGADTTAAALWFLLDSPFKNIVVDDINYYMQDWYMANALAKGWDAPKQIGFFMGKIFDAIEALDKAGKNIYVMAHPEFVSTMDGRQEVKMKTTGKMVDEYVTPSGKFDLVLLGDSKYDALTKRVIKQYQTNENEYYKGVKSPIGMIDELFVPNDLGPINDAVNAFYKANPK